MSTWDHIPATSSATLLDKLQDEVTIAKHKADESKATMATLLRDVYSVQTQFVFIQDESCSGYGLWAHRAILSRYPAIEELLKQAADGQSYKDLDLGPLTLTVDNVSF